MQLSEQSSRTPMLVSIAVAALGTLLLTTYVRQFQREVSGGAPVSLLATRRDVSAGEPIRDEMLIVHDLPESYTEARQIRASELDRVIGVRAAVDLEANQTLTWTDLASTRRDPTSLSARIPRGMRAMSIEQPARKAFGELLRPGDRVDVLLTKIKPGPEGRAVTVPLLQNLLVLAVGNSMGSLAAGGAASRSDFVTVLLTVDQASLLAHARRDGALSLVLRNQNDLEIDEGLPETDDADVLEQESRARRQRRIRIEKVD